MGSLQFERCLPMDPITICSFIKYCNCIERPKPLRPSPTTGVRFDSASQYLSGTWPRDSSFPRIDTEEKSTQTPDEWEDQSYGKKKHKRSASVGNGDLQLALYRQRLQRTTKEGAKNVTTVTHRQSPVQGNHLVPPSNSLYAVTGASKAICIPNMPSRTVPSRCSVSLEGLNQEIENFVLSKHAPADDDYKCREYIPDGHRAPVLELIRSGGPCLATTSGGTRSIDTQTPSGYAGDPCSGSSSSSSRCQSISPSFAMDTSRPGSGVSRSDSADSTHQYPIYQIRDQPMDEEPSEGYMEIKADDCASPELNTSTYAFSPLPNKSYSFVREPPDGCEKVNITQENRLAPAMKEHLFFCPPKENQFVLKPSDRSAFCPPYLPTAGRPASAFMSQRTIETQ